MGCNFSSVRVIRSARAIRSLAVGIALFLVVACQLFGQIDRGTIQGVVKDQSGGVVPDAKALVIQTETNSAIELRTNSEGAYVAPNLPAAIYRLEFEKAGFGKVVRQPIDVRPRAESRVDVTMNTGTVSESITITAEAPILDPA